MGKFTKAIAFILLLALIIGGFPVWPVPVSHATALSVNYGQVNTAGSPYQATPAASSSEDIPVDQTTTYGYIQITKASITSDLTVSLNNTGADSIELAFAVANLNDFSGQVNINQLIATGSSTATISGTTLSAIQSMSEDEGGFIYLILRDGNPSTVDQFRNVTVDVAAPLGNSATVTTKTTNGNDDLTISQADGTISSGQVVITDQRTISVLMNSLNLPANASVKYFRAAQAGSVTDAATHNSNAGTAISPSSYPTQRIVAGDFLSIVSEDGTVWRKYTLSLSSYTTLLNNTILRFGSGSEDSIYSTGSLKQPWYNQGNTFYKLTFSSHPLNYAMGVGGTSASSWNTAGTVVVDDSMGSNPLDIDYSQLTSGYGTVIAKRIVTIDGKTLGIINKYELGQNNSFIKVTTTVENESNAAAGNIRFWVGTRDDYVGGTDAPMKVKGNLSEDGTFVPLSTSSDRASALKIYSGEHAVLFFSTESTAEMIVGNYDGTFTSLLSMDPRGSYVADSAYDGKYGMYINLGDISVGQSSSFVWFYAAGSASDIGNIARSVANAAGVSSFDSYTSSGAVMKYSANTTGHAFTLVKLASEPAPDQTTVVNNGSMTAIEVANTNFLIHFSGLAESTDYKVYSVFRDGAGNLTAVATASFSTLDGTAPVIATSYPAMGTITKNSASIKVKSNEAGTYYTLLKLASQAAPTVANVTASGATTAIAAANTEYSKSFTSLLENTAYVIYSVLKDAAGNLTEMFTNAFQTLDATAPTYVASYPTVSGITANGATMTFQSNEAGTIYTIVRASSAASPGAMEVVTSGTATSVTSANTLYSVSLPSLSPNTEYTIYAVLVDGSGNQTTVAAVSFKTLVQTNRSSAPQPSNQTTVMINGQNTNIGTRSTETKDGVSQTVVSVNESSFSNIINQLKQGTELSIPVTNPTQTNTTQTNTEASQLRMTVGQVDQLFHQDVTLTVDTGQVQYSLPPQSIDVDGLVAKFGAGADQSKIEFDITISDVPDKMLEVVQNTAAKDEFSIVIPPVAFNVSATYNGQTVNVTQFSQHVSREIALPAGTDPKKITTAIVIKEDGTTYHVPTDVYQKDGQWYARISSLTNSVYALIYNEATFADTKGRWFEAPVAEAASRTILAGYADGTFRGTNPITRAEFASMIVNTLGLDRVGTSNYPDVKDANWFYGVVSRASEYKVVSGRSNGNFDPNAYITRQEAMIMMQRAGVLCGLVPGVVNAATGNAAAVNAANVVNAAVVLSDDYADQASISVWAKDAVEYNLKFGLMKGSNGELKPRDNITRAEAAVTILRLLQKSDLIDPRTTL